MAYGHAAQMAMDVDSTIDVGSEAYEFLTESMVRQKTVLDTNGIRGTRSHLSERTRFGTNAVGGSISFNPAPDELDNLLPRILGATAVGDVFDVAETLPSFTVFIDKVGDVFQYDDCKVNRATFRASAGGLLELTLDIFAFLESQPATAYPAITATIQAPYVWHDSVVTLESGARVSMDMEIVIDNFITPRFTNSTNATDLTAGDRVVSVKTTVPGNVAEIGALYEQALAGATGSYVFTNGTFSLDFTFGTIQFEDITPVVGGKGEIVLLLSGIARDLGAAPDIKVTSDATP